jgi:hypothetical protein
MEEVRRLLQQVFLSNALHKVIGELPIYYDLYYSTTNFKLLYQKVLGMERLYIMTFFILVKAVFDQLYKNFTHAAYHDKQHSIF